MSQQGDGLAIPRTALRVDVHWRPLWVADVSAWPSAEGRGLGRHARDHAPGAPRPLGYFSVGHSFRVGGQASLHSLNEPLEPLIGGIGILWHIPSHTPSPSILEAMRQSMCRYRDGFSEDAEAQRALLQQACTRRPLCADPLLKRCDPAAAGAPGAPRGGLGVLARAPCPWPPVQGLRGTPADRGGQPAPPSDRLLSDFRRLWGAVCLL